MNPVTLEAQLQFLAKSKRSYESSDQEGKLRKDCQKSIFFRKWAEEEVMNGRKGEVGGNYFKIRKIFNLISSIIHD